MKKVIKEFEVYKFDELPEKARYKAINNEIEFWLDLDYEQLPEEIQKACDKAESMQTSWFVGEYIWDYAEEFILTCCRDYKYLKDGSVFNE